MHTDYLSPAIRQLRDQQLRFAPNEKQIQQADLAEKLLERAGSEANVHLPVRLSSGHEQRLPVGP